MLVAVRVGVEEEEVVEEEEYPIGTPRDDGKGKGKEEDDGMGRARIDPNLRLGGGQGPQGGFPADWGQNHWDGGKDGKGTHFKGEEGDKGGKGNKGSFKGGNYDEEEEEDYGKGKDGKGG